MNVDSGGEPPPINTNNLTVTQACMQAMQCVTDMDYMDTQQNTQVETISSDEGRLYDLLGTKRPINQPNPTTLPVKKSNTKSNNPNQTIKQSNKLISNTFTKSN